MACAGITQRAQCCERFLASNPFAINSFSNTADRLLRTVNKLMGDPRNVAHAKKVSQEKHHKDKHAPKAGPAPSQHTKNVQTDKKPASVVESPAKSEVAKPTQPAEPTQLEKSLVVLSKLKELEFHSRANIEKLAELSLTIEEELKQKALQRRSEPFTARRMHFNPGSWN